MSSQRKTTLWSNLIPKCRFDSNKLHTSGLLRVYPLLGKASCTVSGAHMSAQPGTKCKCQVLGHEHGMKQEEEDSFSTESKEECSPFVLTHSSFESKAKHRTEKDEEIKCLFFFTSKMPAGFSVLRWREARGNQHCCLICNQWESLQLQNTQSPTSAFSWPFSFPLLYIKIEMKMKNLGGPFT